jgi:Zn-dependent M28 family amino/carboxypeptidase
MFVLLALLLAVPPPDLSALGAKGLAAIRAEALSAHVRFLADDALEGRGTGTRGHAIAARYVAAELQAMGYAPAGDGGTYFQRVPFVGMTVQPEDCALVIEGTRLEYAKEVLFYPRAGSASDEVTGELIFAGYAVSAKEYAYDDFPKDLKGKIAVVLYGAPRSDRPDFFPTAASAVYSDGVRKARLLAERGAVGVVTVFTPAIAHHLPFPFFARQAPFEQMVHLEGNKPGAGSALPAARVPYTMLQRLLAKTGRSAEQIFADGAAGRLKPFPLGIRATLRTSAVVRQFESENVVGILRGGERANEHVVVSAHIDHLGIGPAINGDTIYNGAVDNASGTAAMLEVARAFAALPTRPPRSVLALAVTGEEKGLQGSEYFSKHPTVPVASIVADVNLDGVHWQFEPFDMVALGAEHSTLARAVKASLAAMKMRESPDPEPEQVFFIRSDQYNFVKQGIPAVFPGAAWQDEHGNVDKRKAYDEWWTKNRYHQPSDEWDPKGNYENMVKETRADFLIALAVALDPERPSWNPGDVFGKLFGR